MGQLTAGAKAVQKVKGLTIRRGKRGDVWKFKLDLYRDGVYQRTVYATLGTTSDMSLELAQARAATLAASVRRGIDPTRSVDVPSMTVRQLMDHYAQDLAERGMGVRYRTESVERVHRYLPKWLDRPFVGLTRAECKSEHKRITRDHGPRVANMVIGHIGTAWKIALETLDGEIPTDIPTKAVRRNAEHAKNHTGFSWTDFNARAAKAGPVVQAALALAATTGLRKANVVGLRREWVDGDRLVIPREHMKVKDPRRGPFVVPLVVPLPNFGTPWAFPGKGGQHIVNLPFGHTLRHMHFTAGMKAGLSPYDLSLLHDHAFDEGMAGTYGQRSFMETPREGQERIKNVLIQDGFMLPPFLRTL